MCIFTVNTKERHIVQGACNAAHPVQSYHDGVLMAENRNDIHTYRKISLWDSP